jgi:hypothetical protein
MISIQRPNKDLIHLSVITSYGLNYSNSVTAHPVENGSKISDHIQSENLKVSLNGVVVDTDIFSGTNVVSVPAILEQNSDVILTAAGGAKVKLGGDFVKQALLDARNNKELCTIIDGEVGVTGRATGKVKNVYNNCVITSLSFSEGTDSGDGVEVSLTLEQIKLVTLREVVVNVPPQKQSAGKGTTGKNKGNKKDDKPATNTPAQDTKPVDKGKVDMSTLGKLGQAARDKIAEYSKPFPLN